MTFVSYLPIIRGGFIWDDDVHVTQNLCLRTVPGLARIWTRIGATPQYYPLTQTTFWIEHHLWADNPLPYHLANVALHAASALVLWRLLQLLEIPGAWLAAAIFAVHPLNVESVAWVTERKNTLSGFFYLLSAWAMFKAFGVADGDDAQERPGIRRGCYAAGLILFAAALLSKTVAATLPAATVLILWWKKKRVRRIEVILLIPVFILGISMGQLTAWMERTHVGAAGAEWNLSPIQRLLIAGRAVWFYLGKLVAPAQLSFIYPRWDIHPNTISAWLPLFALAALVVALSVLRRRTGWGPLVGLAFFVGTLVPALGFFNLYPMRYSFVADHFQYLAGIGIIAVVVGIFAKLKLSAAASRLGAALLLALFMLLTAQRADVFASSERLWLDTLEKNPRAWIAADQLAGDAIAQGQYSLAGGYLTQSLEIDPDQIEAHIEMSDLLLQTDRPNDAVNQMRQAVQLQPDKPLPYFALARALLAAGDVNGAMSAYEHALAIDPDFFPARLRIANIETRLGHPDRAAEQRRIADRMVYDLYGYTIGRGN